MGCLMSTLEINLTLRRDKSSKCLEDLVRPNNFICIDTRLCFVHRIRRNMTGLVAYLPIGCRILEGRLIGFSIVHSPVLTRI